MSIKRGTAFLVPSGPNDELHLHVVLTEACKNGQHLIASVSSIKEGWHDATCVFNGSEHKAITKPSFVFYRLVTTMHGLHIGRMLETKYYKEQPDVDKSVCDAICDGVCKSDHTPRGMKRYYNDNSG